MTTDNDITAQIDQQRDRERVQRREQAKNAEQAQMTATHQALDLKDAFLSCFGGAATTQHITGKL